MHEQIIRALTASANEAADDVLLEGLRVGAAAERRVMLDALLARKTVHGLGGVIGGYDALPEALQRHVLASVNVLHHALRECGRSDRPELRLAAIRLIALGRQGKLAYVLSENLHATDEAVAKAATDAMVALARWVAGESKALQRRGGGGGDPDRATLAVLDEREKAQLAAGAPAGDFDAAAVYAELMAQRGEIEAAIARAVDAHRTRVVPELVRAALLLCDTPASKTLAILGAAKHGGHNAMVRRLQQPPAPEHADAFLIAARNGHLKVGFGSIFSNVEEAPALDALLRRTYWLADPALRRCVHQVTRGTWWNEADLQRDIDRRDPADAAKIGAWLDASGTHDLVQDERMVQLLERAKEDFPARLRLLRLALARPAGGSCLLLRTFLNDADERLVRMAAREIVRRKPQDHENVLLKLMAAAPDSVRRVVGRSIGPIGFEHFWQRFDRMDKPTRKQAGKVMLKLLPDAAQRLARRLSAGSVDDRLKAMAVAQDLGLVGEGVRPALIALAAHPHPKVRSKAIALLGEMKAVAPAVLLERVMKDVDPRVRANAIEALETPARPELAPLWSAKAKSAAHSRERANAIKALHQLRVPAAADQLQNMLRDARPEHRISALWVLRRIAWWRLLGEVARLAKEDGNMRVRRYALTVLKSVAELAQQERARAAAGPGSPEAAPTPDAGASVLPGFAAAAAKPVAWPTLASA